MITLVIDAVALEQVIKHKQNCFICMACKSCARCNCFILDQLVESHLEEDLGLVGSLIAKVLKKKRVKP